jgi:O-antigen/teichoic acid export membrane protein
MTTDSGQSPHSLLDRLLPQGIRVGGDQLREFSWLAGGQAFAVLLSLVSIKLVSTIGAAEYGKYVLALSVGGMLNLALYGPMEQGYIRMFFYYSTPDGTRAGYFRSLKWLLARLSGALTLVAGLGILAGQIFFGLEIPFTAATAASILLTATAIPVTGLLGALRLRREVSLLSIIERVAFIILLLGVRWIVPLTATAILACLALSTGMILVARVSLLDRNAGPPPVPAEVRPGPSGAADRREIFSRILDYARPFLLWGGVAWIQSNGERWVIDGVMAKADVGRYGLAANLVNNSAVLVVGVIGQFLGPIIYRQFSSSADAELRKGKAIIRMNTLVTVVIFGAAGLLLAYFGDVIIHAVSSHDFTMDGHILLLLTFGLGAFHVGQAMTSLGLAGNRPGVYVVPKFAAALVSLVLYYVGCRYWGLTGLVSGLFLANMLYVALIWNANRKLTGT